MLNPLKSLYFILDHPLVGFGLCLLVSWVIYNNLPLLPQNSPQMILERQYAILEEGLVIAEDQYLLPISSPTMKMPIYGAIISNEDKTIRILSGDEMAVIVNEKYPQMAGLLLCMIHRESGFNQIALGDKGKAYGAFQIWKDVHGLTELEAFNFNFALDWTVEKIRNGEMYLWTTFKSCAEENEYSFNAI